MDYNPIAPSIRDVLAAIKQRKTLDDVVALILHRACELSDAVHGSFVQVDYDNQYLVIAGTHGPDWTLEKRQTRQPVNVGITGWVATHGVPYLCPDVAQDPYYYPLFEFVRSEMGVPVVVNNRVWGVIVMDGLAVNAFDQGMLATVTMFAELAAFAITLQLELKEQERLQRYLVQSEKLASLGEIIAGIAHEINNPLTSILGHASLLTQDQDKEAAAASIDAIMQEARRTADLVKNLLAFSRKEAGNQREHIGANQLIERVCAMKRYQLRVNNIGLVFEPAATSYPLYVSAAQIQQVLLNLINNAEQAIPPYRRDGCIRILLEQRGQRVAIGVQDNGSGIPQELQKLIFDPFFTTKPVGEGTGLGLSIAHSIIKNHGGQIAFNSAPTGTTFWIELPLATEPAAGRPVPLKDAPAAAISNPIAAAATRTQNLRSVTNKASSTATKPKPTASKNGNKVTGRVLVVDDEPQILESLASFLEMQSIETGRAGDALSALALLQAQEFDVIISDIRMPGMDGLQFYEHARGMEPRYAQRFIFISGDLVRETTRAFIHATGCPYLEKPFSFETLYHQVASHLSNGREEG